MICERTTDEKSNKCRCVSCCWLAHRLTGCQRQAEPENTRCFDDLMHTHTHTQTSEAVGHLFGARERTLCTVCSLELVCEQAPPAKHKKRNNNNRLFQSKMANMPAEPVKRQQRETASQSERARETDRNGWGWRMWTRVNQQSDLIFQERIKRDGAGQSREREKKAERMSELAANKASEWQRKEESTGRQVPTWTGTTLAPVAAAHWLSVCLCCCCCWRRHTASAAPPNPKRQVQPRRQVPPAGWPQSPLTPPATVVGR